MSDVNNFVEDYRNLINTINKMTKDKDGYGYKYVELTPLLEEVMPKVHENHFILIQSIKQNEGTIKRNTHKQDNAKGTEESTCIETPCFVLRSELIHDSGKEIISELPLYVDDVDPQAFGSAETYARRYAIYALLHIKTEDDDGAGASAKAKKKKAEPVTFADFVKAIADAPTEKAISSLWYKWKVIFSENSEEYKNLTKFSRNMKLKANGENVTDVYFGCSEIVKTILEGEE